MSPKSSKGWVRKERAQNNKKEEYEKVLFIINSGGRFIWVRLLDACVNLFRTILVLAHGDEEVINKFYRMSNPFEDIPNRLFGSKEEG